MPFPLTRKGASVFVSSLDSSFTRDKSSSKLRFSSVHPP
jgi:hypothetical protein